jgi:hypothetical protein
MHTIWDWMNIGLAFFGFVIGMWGIYLAVKAQKDGRKLANENRDQLNSLQTLANENRDELSSLQTLSSENRDQLSRLQTLSNENRDQLSSLHTLSENLTNTVQTRAIGHFPENMRAIVALIKATTERLVIATDVASYGQLSNPDECARYHAALVACVARDVSVEIIAYSGARSDAERRWQFTDYVKKGDDGFRELVGEDRWKHFAEKNGIVNVKNCDDVFEALVFADLKFRHGISQTSTVKVFDLPNPVDTLPVFFWLRDGEEAIFSLFTVGENQREISFRTIDQSITDILSETFTALKDTHKAVPTPLVLDLTEYAYLLQKP